MGNSSAQDKLRQNTESSANALREDFVNQLRQTYHAELQDDYRPGFFGISIAEIEFIKNILAKPILTTSLETISDLYQFRNELNEIKQRGDKNQYKRVQAIFDSPKFISISNTANESWDQINAEISNQSKIIKYEMSILQHLMATEKESAITHEENISTDTLALLRKNYQFHQNHIANNVKWLKAASDNHDEFSVFYEQLMRRLQPNINSQNRLLDYQREIQARQQVLLQLEVAAISYSTSLKNVDDISLQKYLYAKTLISQYSEYIQAQEKEIYWRYSLKTKVERQTETLMFKEIEAREKWYQNAYNSDVFSIQRQTDIALQMLLPASDQFDSTLGNIQEGLPGINIERNDVENKRILKYAGVRVFEDKVEDAKIKLMQEMAYGFNKIEGKSQQITLPHLDTLIAFNDAQIKEISAAKKKSQPNFTKKNSVTHKVFSTAQSKSIAPITHATNLLDNDNLIFGSSVTLGFAIGLGIGIALSFVTFGGSMLVGGFIGALVGGFVGAAAGEAVNKTREARKIAMLHIKPRKEILDESTVKPESTIETVTIETPAPNLIRVHNSETDVFHRLADKNHSEKEIIQDNQLYHRNTKNNTDMPATPKKIAPKFTPSKSTYQHSKEEDNEGDSKTESEGDTNRGTKPKLD